MKNNRKKYQIVFLMIPLLLSGCASIGKTTLFGVGIGGAVGTGFGLAANSGVSSALIGLGIGAAVGAGMGYLGHKDKEEKDALMTAFLKKKSTKEEYPTLRAPEASCTRVGEKIEGSRYIGPHIVCDIEKQAVWGR